MLLAPYSRVDTKLGLCEIYCDVAGAILIIWGVFILKSTTVSRSGSGKA